MVNKNFELLTLGIITCVRQVLSEGLLNCTSEKHVRHSLPFLYYVLMVLAKSDNCTRRGTGAAPLYCSLANTLI